MPSNVEYGDYIQLPANFKDFQQVKVSWYQDHGVIPKEVVSRSATYCVGYGYSIYEPADEVLVFVATEMLADDYAFAPGHLSKSAKWKIVPAKDLAGAYIELEVNEDWQYGSVSGYDRFIVYHPKSRKPFSKRFTNAVSVTPGVLNGLVADAKTALKASGASETGFGLGAMVALSAVEGVVGKVAEVADGKLGERLKDFVQPPLRRSNGLTKADLTQAGFRKPVKLSPNDPIIDDKKK